jgi:parallel beta-helix repeat protein
LTQAIKKLESGDTLIIAKGTYRESIDLRTAPGLQKKMENEKGSAITHIKANANAEVWIKGSDIVTDWEKVEDNLFVKRKWAANSQQVFVDGIALKQIGGSILNGFPDKPNHPMKKLHQSNGGIWPGRIAGELKDMIDKSFFYDAKSQSLYVKYSADSLEGRNVEVSVRPYLLTGQNIDGLEVKNIHFSHANTTAVSQSGAISLNGDNLLLEGIEITQVDGNGFDITGNNNVLKNNVANYCGQVGMKVRGKNARVLDNETSYNNARGFNKWWEAGGAKFVGDGGLQDSEVAGHRAYFNQGDGIWFDWKNSGNKIHDNISAYNSGIGIQYESSDSAKIYNNYVFGNKQRGIYLPNSSNSVVAHNLVISNGMEGIVIIDEAKNHPMLKTEGNKVIGNIVAWNAKTAIVLPSETRNNSSDSNLFLGNQQPSFSMGWGSKERPIRRGLNSWSEMSGQDKQSRHKDTPMPAALAAELQAQKFNPDWSVLNYLLGNFEFPKSKGAFSLQHLLGSDKQS